jgi:large subunit ribosomal protein L23
MSILKHKPEVAKASHVAANPVLAAATAHVLLHPLVTEKAVRLASLRQYVFSVAPTANKVQVSQAIIARYGVRPTSVNIMAVAGKKVRSRSGQRGQRKDWRKAIVTVPVGSTLTLNEGV